MLKIKRLITICVLILFTFSVNAKESKYCLKEDAYLYHYKHEKYIKAPSSCFYIDDYDYSFYSNSMIRVKTNDDYCDVTSADIYPWNSDSYIREEYLNSPNDNYCLIPTYYLDVIAKKDRELLRGYDPESIEFYGEPNEYEDGWYRYILPNVIISNSCISFGRGHLYVENINSLKNGFSVETLHYTFMKEDGCKKLNFIFDGDYLNVYIEGNITPIYSFFKIKKSDYEQLEKFIFIPREYFLPSGYLYDNAALEKFNSENAVDVKSFIWPRHADGSCDYEDNKKTTSTSQSSSTPKLDTTIQSTSSSETNVAVKKTMTVSENLKLRAGEATSTQVLTVMAAGTKVKILELGKAETIDGINSNWVKVEVQSGAKDRDANPIKSGTIGWCYGGYLN